MRSAVRALVLLSSLSLSPLALSACAPVTVQTEAGKIAYTADQVALRITELQNAAIKAEAATALPTATTRAIVEFSVSALKTLQSTPGGWQTILPTAWTETKRAIGAQTNPSVIAAMGAVDIVLAIQTGQTGQTGGTR